jgi:hypothetical protein
MKLVTLMINNQQDVPIDEMWILTSRFDFVIYKGLGQIKKENKFNFKEVIVSALKSLIQIK